MAHNHHVEAQTKWKKKWQLECKNISEKYNQSESPCTKIYSPPLIKLHVWVSKIFIHLVLEMLLERTKKLFIKSGKNLPSVCRATISRQSATLLYVSKTQSEKYQAHMLTNVVLNQKPVSMLSTWKPDIHVHYLSVTKLCFWWLWNGNLSWNLSLILANNQQISGQCQYL